MPGEPELEVEAILRAVGIIHAPAVVYGRVGQPMVVEDGVIRLEIVRGESGWRWCRNGQGRGRLEGLDHLTRILVAEAERYAEASPVLRGIAAQCVAERYADWLDEADDMVVPRPWGVCAPGRPGEGMRRQWVLFDADDDVTVGRIGSEAARLHPDAYVCIGQDLPVLVDDGMVSMLFLEQQDGWQYSIDGVDCGMVQDYLDLQVILVDRAMAYAAANDEERKWAARRVAELASLPFEQRRSRARERAMDRRMRASEIVEDTRRVPVPAGLREGARP
ncbi:hypothetical protein [Paraliomyxa miuraensis]|uniref:hypothetical protein n=1 Tax=Paraliomyxa miuraensis TaxID=376150 RepID=UPI002250BC0E|nr:hypothetical protein [Paraliomyxa miuraensis]MCX4244194.1 hypothetical protein [Paraliomyxa miuraensis]